ncbi:MAG: site-specific integrase [Planctomycetales bacterium]
MSRKRRGRGEGGVYQRGGRWCATITVGYNERGERKRRTISGATKVEVLQKLAKLQGQKVDGTLTEAVKMTVAQWMRHWLETTAKRRVRPMTLQGYEELARLHVNPHVGGIGLAKLTPAHVETWMTHLEHKGLSPRRRHMALAVLQMALNTATKQGVLPRNVCHVVEKPRSQPKEMRTLTHEEAQRFLGIAKEHRLYALFVLAITAGMRQGELAGLEWSDVDLDQGILNVRRTLYKRRKYMVGPPKTRKSIRRIRLPQAAVDALREHRGKMPADQPRVFTNPLGQGLYSTKILLIFKRLLAKADCPIIRFHDLRHTYATLALAAGVPVKVVSDTMGHSRASVTLDIYAHTLPSQEHLAAEAMDKLFKTA